MARGEKLVGCMITVTSTMLVDIVATIGFDYLFLEAEHGLTSRQELRECIRAAAVHRVPVVVRVSGPSRVQIGQTLDAGAAGIVVPHIETARELAQVVAYTRYAPIGQRGLGSTVPWLRYFKGTDPDSWTPGVIAIVESVKGVNAVKELVRVPGVAAIFPGPGDLSQELGVDLQSPRLLELLRQANDAVSAVAEGPALMAYHPMSGSEELLAVGAGASVILVGPDFRLLRHVCAQALDRARNGAVQRAV